MRIVLALLVATWYTGPTGEPLFCGGTYSESSAWVALSLDEYGETWQCGDLIYVSFGQGDALLARVQDAGGFGKHCVLQVDGRCIPIGVDVPRHLWPIEGALSAPVRVYNITAECRKWGYCE